MAQWAFIEWLLLWLLEVENFDFDWDEGNSSKSVKKHRVAAREAEEVFRLRMAMPLGSQITPPVTEERLGVVGITSSGRCLMIVFTIRNGRIRIISGRSANRKERGNHEKYLREISKRI
ncbi:MAG: BrnT family toxin [Bdellovibrionales bacterium]